MTRILACFVVMLFLAASPLSAQTASPPRQLGVSVEMAAADSAQPMPAADEANAWVVTIDRAGTMFFRANRTDLTELANWMKSNPRDRDAKLYVKADVGVGFAIVHKVLNAGRDAGFDAAVLLTQTSPSFREGVVPPAGMAVEMGPAAEGLISVQMIKTSHQSPLLKINNQSIPVAAFGMTLGNVLEAQKNKTILFKADDQLLFSQVAHLIDECRSAGATVRLAAQP